MTTMRKPEDVVLDVYAERLAWGCVDLVDRGTRENMDAALRTYIAEADLIPRPQTLKEWMSSIPEQLREEYERIDIKVTRDGDTFFNLATIPRPKPPRMTDEEIDRAAIIYASNCIEGHFAQDGGGAYLEGLTLDDLVEAGSVYHKAYLSERARLEKERADE